MRVYGSQTVNGADRRQLLLGGFAKFPTSEGQTDTFPADAARTPRFSDVLSCSFERTAGTLGRHRIRCDPRRSVLVNSRVSDMRPVFENPMRGIACKIASVVLFLGMQTFIKLAGAGIQPGQVTFYRSFFALFPIVAFLPIAGS